MTSLLLVEKYNQTPFSTSSRTGWDKVLFCNADLREPRFNTTTFYCHNLSVDLSLNLPGSSTATRQSEDSPHGNLPHRPTCHGKDGASGVTLPVSSPYLCIKHPGLPDLIAHVKSGLYTIRTLILVRHHSYEHRNECYCQGALCLSGFHRVYIS